MAVNTPGLLNVEEENTSLENFQEPRRERNPGSPALWRSEFSPWYVWY